MGARKFTQKQIRYLWAVGFYRSSPHHSKRVDSVKSFQGQSDADAWGETSLGNIFEPSTPQALRQAVDEYRGTEFSTINRSLRRSSGTDVSHPVVKHLDETFESYARETPETVKVSRGVRGGFADLLAEAFESGKLKEGSTLRDYGYLSTSLNPKMVGKFTSGSNRSGDTHVGSLEITVPKGTKALFLGSNYESELLLQRGSEIRITSVKKVEKDQGIFLGKRLEIQMTGELLPRERR